MENEKLQSFIDTASEIDEEDLRLMDEEDQIRQESINLLNSGPSDETRPVEETSKEVETNKEDGNLTKTTAEAALAIPTGGVDWGISLVNKALPGEQLDIPSIPKFENEITQSIRDISSVVLPSILITKGLGAAGSAAHAKVGWKLGSDPFVKWISKAGLAGLGGLAADSIAPVQERDHNALGMIKKSFPLSTGWISEDLATLDTDEPDIKRQKNMKEGVGLGFFADVVVAGGRLAKSLKGVNRATQWVPKNEKAKSVIDKIRNPKPLSTDPLEDAVMQSAKRRSDDLDELGNSKIENGVNLDEPQLGVHDIYDYYESGIRSADSDGIFGASVDAVKIANNIDSVYGRVGSVFTESAIKFGIEADDAGYKLIKEQADILKDSKYGYNGSNGRYISHDEVVEIGEGLAADLYKMDVPEMNRLLKGLSGVDPDTGARVLQSEAYAGVMEAIKKYADDFINMDLARAQAYIGTSLAGQVSDMSQGARLMNENQVTVRRAQEQILDRLQYLMQIKGQTSYARGRALNMLNLWNRLGKQSSAVTKESALKAIREEKNATLKALARIQAESQQTIDTLRIVKEERPQLLGPLMLAYEVTDGKVKSVSALNDYIRNTTGVFKKALFDGRTDMPSAWTQGLWSNIYNSVLSAVGTPLRAGASNLTLMIERPIATWMGAKLAGDAATLRRGHYMYRVGMVDTLQKAMSHMNQVFKRASTDPDSVSYIMRDDIVRKNEDTVTLLRSFADAKEAEGFFGPSAITNQIEAMNDLAEHPVLRFSANAMTAFDGFTRSFIGSVEARGKAYDTIINAGEKVTPKKLKQISDGIYDLMFDDKGFITDKAVEHASREIAMNQNIPAVDSLSQLINRAPILKPFLMFPKTSMNMLAFSGSHNPLGLFINDLTAFKLPFEEMDFLDVERLLKERGIPIDENVQSAYNTIRAELKGRKAIGTLTVLGAVGMFTGDNIRGNGLYDKSRQRTRRELGWKPRTYRGLDGKWHTFDNMGALSDWLSLTADIMDNFDTLDEPSIEVLLNKMGHILAANLTNKSFTAGLEPLNDVLAGNPAALSRWGASFTSSLLPGSGFRSEFGRLLEPQIKEVEQEFFQQLANRNAFAKSTLPDTHDWVDGGKVGEPTDFFTRVWNAYSPWWKQSERLSPEKQFLIDIEFDGRPSLRTNGKGVEYTIDERSEITDLMGQSKYFRNEVRKIMNSVSGKEFRKAYKKSPVGIDRKRFIQVHSRLSKALRNAQTLAESQISTKNQLHQKLYQQRLIDKYTTTGETEKIKEILIPTR